MEKQLNLFKKIGFGEVFDWTFDIYSKNFFYFIRVLSYFFIPALLILIIYGYIIIGKMQDMFSFFKLLNTTSPNEIIKDSLFKFLSLIADFSIIIFVYSLLILLIQAASVKAISIKIEGKNDTDLDVVKFTLKKILLLILSSIVITLLICLAFCFAIAPGFLFIFVSPVLWILYFIIIITVLLFAVYGYTSFISQAMMIEEKFFVKSLTRSITLVRKNFWPLIGLNIIFYFLFSFIESIAIIPVFAVPYVKFIMQIIKFKGETSPDIAMAFFKEFAIYYMIALVISLILYMFYIPLYNIGITLKYYNIKNLKEGAALLNSLEQVAKNDTELDSTKKDNN